MRAFGLSFFIFLLTAYMAIGQNEDVYDQKKAHFGYDISDPEEIKTNILTYASDSLLTIRQNLPVKLKKKPKVVAKNRTTFLRDTDIVVIDFVNGFYKLAANNIVVYIDPENLNEPNFDFSNKKDYVLELRNVKDSIEEEARNRKYSLEQLKKEEFYVSKWGRSVYDRIKMGQCWIGMTEEMAKVGGFYPGWHNVNTMVTVYGTREQWECRNGMVLTFEGGILKDFHSLVLSKKASIYGKVQTINPE